MEKITPEKAIEHSKYLDRFIWYNNPFWIFTDCVYEELNGEQIVYYFHNGETTTLFLPKKFENMVDRRILSAYEDDIKIVKDLGIEIKEKIFLGTEFIYKTSDLVELKDSKYSSFRRNLNKFKKNNYKIFDTYPKEKILAFLEKWAEQKDLTKKTDSAKDIFLRDLRSCRIYVDLLDKIPHKAIFVEINKELVGFTVFYQLSKDHWVAVMQKVDYRYRGLTQFLYHEKSKIMLPGKYFTTGTQGEDTSLAKFKESLHPAIKIDSWILDLGNK